MADKRMVRAGYKKGAWGRNKRGIQRDLIPDKIERHKQVIAVNSGPKRRRNLYFVTCEHVCISKSSRCNNRAQRACEF